MTFWLNGAAGVAQLSKHQPPGVADSSERLSDVILSSMDYVASLTLRQMGVQLDILESRLGGRLCGVYHHGCYEADMWRNATVISSP